jgi:hypothetical protein
VYINSNIKHNWQWDSDIRNQLKRSNDIEWAGGFKILDYVQCDSYLNEHTPDDGQLRPKHVV